MILGRVTGTVHATAKNARLEGGRMLVVRPLGLDGKVHGRPLISLDRVDAGVGDTVLAIREGGSARILYGDDMIPIQGVVVAVVDRVDAEVAG